jgi:hypothetical protein
MKSHLKKENYVEKRKNQEKKRGRAAEEGRRGGPSGARGTLFPPGGATPYPPGRVRILTGRSFQRLSARLSR